ncbi:MAG: DEAD/DEAH box helicase family protein [Lachnospiraceae bacterium]|nr:DEAD/DEAH box helicase family protein [Lachnospiraceae bacterium]
MDKHTLLNEYAIIKRQQLESSPYSCLDNDKIDLNPHQIEALMFAVEAVKLGGAILADEVGLGKTIEAGLVMRFLYKSGYRKMLLIIPSSLCRQWQIELYEKFAMEAAIVDRQNLESYHTEVSKEFSVVIVSYNFAAGNATLLSNVKWDLVIFDEAHKLRNVHKAGSKQAERILQMTKGIPKLMLTATPIQNSLWDLYGLVQYIDPEIFLDKRVFSRRYIRDEEYDVLKFQLSPIVQRTLRSEVVDYLQFSSRIGITVDFRLSPQEAALYVAVNNYLKKDILYAVPASNRTLVTIAIRKLLASSSQAVAETFKVLRSRLIVLQQAQRVESVDESLDAFFNMFDDDYEEEEEALQEELFDREKVNEFIQKEIDEVDGIISLAENIRQNAKLNALKKALIISFQKQSEQGIHNKAVVFTESLRTQAYLFDELSACGYGEKILLFNGNMNDQTTKDIYRAWRSRHYNMPFAGRNIEIKNAIVEAFRDEYQILLVTDSGSEGLNLQFCNTVINYDLPWNPQRIEQRIGRCHRYGQKQDVMVINLLNTENIADRRVYEILAQKFELFEGVFGASDKAIGLLESGENFEKRILQIYQQCSNKKEFNREFTGLEKELERKRGVRALQLRSMLSKTNEEEHRNAFRQRMKDVQEYFTNREYWNSVNGNTAGKYPMLYELKKKPAELQGHGYLLIGGLYDGQKLLEPVLNVLDRQLRIRRNLESVLVQLLQNVCESNLSSCPFVTEAGVCVDALEKYLLNKRQEDMSELLLWENYKIENWRRLRLDDFTIRVQEIEDKIAAVREEYDKEKNFKAKISLKKDMENLEQSRTELLQRFHEFTGTVDREAAELQMESKRNMLGDPVLMVKVVVRF